MGCLSLIAILIGIACFLLMEHTLVFWLVFVPLVVLCFASGLKFFTSKGWGIGYFVLAFFLLFVIIIVAMIVSSTDKCEHENTVELYSFAAQNSTAHSNVRPYCRDCGEKFEYQLFKGELVDKSYLSAIQENSDGDEIVPGEYYTVTATVPLGFTAYSSNTVWLNCKVENEEFTVCFNVEFRDEFEEAVRLVEEGETITFRGRFYDEGCGFTDCELLERVAEAE